MESSVIWSQIIFPCLSLKYVSMHIHMCISTTYVLMHVCKLCNSLTLYNFYNYSQMKFVYY